ncbi:hypothetical protein HC251_18000 [Iamia sp. SCSIO 61187]|uniref:hypothetical protein n=1 Tax=Iamia sp. SCSIO 61187 TaxID=2722752 RepID=UPI001C62CC22|nr:hypothetical protein [Iamia sp. SCSIO 61187]QYG94149.1 hypothetical protein HC251_18000 [Iamia sp. SCSIO 61187]
MVPIPDLPDLAGAAERLRGWLDDLVAAGDRAGGHELVAWHQTHGAHLIAAALALEELAASTPGAPDDAD